MRNAAESFHRGVEAYAKAKGERHFEGKIKSRLVLKNKKYENPLFIILFHAVISRKNILVFKSHTCQKEQN